MKFLKKILNATEIVAKEYTVLYYNEDSKSVNVKGSLKPQITITTADALDTDIIALSATKNETVQGDITWSCNLASDVAEINGSTLVFKQHYEGSVKLTATADNASAEKTISVTCEEVATATTYSIKANSISITETQPMKASSTSATVNFIGITTQHYKLKDSVSVESNKTQTVEFEANKTTEAATRNGSFDWNGQSVAWFVNLKAKEVKPTVELVDLGLSIKWATCNVGATSPEQYGKYFQWGDTVGYEGDEAKAHSTWSTAPFNNGSSSYDSSYFASVSGTVCPNGVLAAQYDAATAAYGEGYRMPTEAECDELIVNTTSTWETVNGVNGRKFTASNGNYIFIPAAGYCINDSFRNVSSSGCAWALNLYSRDPNGSTVHLSFFSGNAHTSFFVRYSGFSVRAVHE